MTPQLSLPLQLLITAPQPQPLNQLAALLAAGQLPLLCELERWIRSRSSGPGNNLATAREFIIVGHAQQGLRPKQSAFTTFSPSSMVRVRALTSSTFPTVGRLLLHLRILTGANGAPSLGRLLLAPTTSLSSLDCSLRVVARVTGHRSFAQSSIHQFTCLIYQMGDNNKPGGFTCHDYDKVNRFFNHPIIVVEAENHRNLPAAPGVEVISNPVNSTVSNRLPITIKLSEDGEGTLASYGSPTSINLTSPQRVIDTLNEVLMDKNNIVYAVSGRTPAELERLFSRIPGLDIIAENGCFKNIVYVMSGRTPKELERLLSRVPGLVIIAENGCFVRECGPDESEDKRISWSSGILP
ncbi:hypothetical protein BKA80DRAFT_343634 [Phyllosticta citrichinensis]